MKLIDILVQELPKRGGWPASLYNYSLLQVSGGGVYQSGGGVELFVAELADDWNQTEITREQYEAALAASKTEWDGEGLPPVGCECEYQWAGDEWKRGKICYTSKQTVLILEVFEGEESESAFGLDDVKFRPIRSEAGKDRDESLCAMRNCVSNFNNTSVIHAIGQVYDAIAAGKIPGIKLED